MMVFVGVAPTISYAAESRAAAMDNSVTDAIDTVIDWVDIDRQDNELVVTLNPNIDQIKGIDSEDIKAILEKILHYAKDAIITAINDEEFLDNLWDIATKAYLTAKGYDSIAEAIDDPELPRELIGYARDVLVELCNAGIIDRDDLSAYKTYAKEKLIAFFHAAGFDFESYWGDKADDIYDCLDGSISGIIANLVNGNILPGTDLTLMEIFMYLEEIKINGHVVFGLNADGALEFNAQGIKALLLSIPTFSQIAAMEPEDMKLSFNVDMAISIDGNRIEKSFGITAKIGSNHDDIKKIAKILDNHINLDLEPGNKVELELIMPEVLTKAILKVANTDHIDPVLKHKVFTAFMATGDDVHAFIQSLSYDDLITLVGLVDFEGMFNSEFVKQYVDLTGYTNEEILDIVKRYEKYFTLAIKYGIRLTNAVANRIPDRYMDNSFLDLIEYEDDNDKFSYADGTFRYEGTHTITYGQVEKLAQKVANILGVNESIANLIVSFIPDVYEETGFTASLDLKIHFEDIYRVDFVVAGKTTRSGFLPAGAIVSYFAEINNPNIIWLDEEGKIVTTMPYRDVVLHAWTADDDSIIQLIGVNNKTYNGEVSYVSAFSKDPVTYTYEWYKDGKLVSKESSFTVKNVSDSGIYECVAKYDGVEVYRGTTEVKISPATIKVNDSSVSLKLPDDGYFTYNGEEHLPTVELAGDLGDYVYVTIPEGSAFAAAGKHTLAVTLLPKDSENYVVENGDVNLDWYVKYVIDTSKLQWQWPVNHDIEHPENGDLPRYDGEAYTMSLVFSEEYLAKLAELGINDVYSLLNINLAGNVTEIEACEDYESYYTRVESVTLKDTVDTNAYVLVGLDNLPGEKEWWIEKAIISFDPTLIKWNTANSFVFDGSAKSVQLDLSALPAEILDLINITPNDNEWTNVGDYVATVTVTPKDPGNYCFDKEYEFATHSWSITPAEFDVSELVWGTDFGFVYGNSNNFATEIEFSNVPAFVEIIYTFFNANGEVTTVVKNAGDYRVVVEIKVDGNHVLTDNNGLLEEDGTLARAFSVAKRVIKVDSNDNEWTNVGDYVATVTVTPKDPGNYCFDKEYEFATHSWSITPAEFDVSELVWGTDFGFVYGNSNNFATEIEFSNVPAFVEIIYTFFNANGEVTTVVKNAGDYRVVVEIKVDGNHVLTRSWL